MHSTGTKNVTFLHNGDYSGEIFIVGKDRDGRDSQVVVEMDDLRGFVFGMIRNELVSTIEDADVSELLRIFVFLGGKFPGTT